MSQMFLPRKLFWALYETVITTPMPHHMPSYQNLQPHTKTYSSYPSTLYDLNVVQNTTHRCFIIFADSKSGLQVCVSRGKRWFIVNRDASDIFILLQISGVDFHILNGVGNNFNDVPCTFQHATHNFISFPLATTETGMILQHPFRSLEISGTQSLYRHSVGSALTHLLHLVQILYWYSFEQQHIGSQAEKRR